MNLKSKQDGLVYQDKDSSGQKKKQNKNLNIRQFFFFVNILVDYETKLCVCIFSL